MRENKREKSVKSRRSIKLISHYKEKKYRHHQQKNKRGSTTTDSTGTKIIREQLENFEYLNKKLHEKDTNYQNSVCIGVSGGRGGGEGKFYKPRSIMASQVVLVVSNLPTKSGDAREARSPGEGNGNPLQYSCPENPMDRGAWQATVHGVSKSQT